MPTDTMQLDAPPRGWFATRWRRFALAVTFLTRLPLPISGTATADDLRASMGWYPVVGLVLGAVGWGFYRAAGLVLPSAVAAAVTIIALEWCTGALHLDGVMDTCDGLGSGAPRERALEIMKDSRVGAKGVFGALAVLLLKVTALAALAPPDSLLPLLVGCMAARLAPIWAVTLFPYARPDGTGKAFTGGTVGWSLPAATLFTLGAGWFLGYLLGQGLLGLGLALLLTALVLFVHSRIARRLGGLTGDVYGMGIELAETLALLIGCMLVQHVTLAASL